MNMEYRRNSGSDVHTGPGILWPLVVVLGVVTALVLALPALALGVALQRLTSGRSWSFPLWFVLAFIGAGIAYYSYSHGLDRLILIQLTDIVLAIKRYHADIAQWNIGRLWSETWPVWLRTLVAVSIVAFWREMEANTRGDSPELLHQQERERQRCVARSKSKASRRTRRLDRIPDAVNGHMIVGVPIDDEYAE